ncbi:TPA: hypothetical protein H2W01_004795 [Salmonella enterica]|nr:hypothetical protein [Salmonella enterica]
MNRQPQIIINAADLSPEQLRVWISEMADDAKKADLDYEITSMRLSSAESSLRYFADDLKCRINFLSSDQIIHSADPSSVIQKELDTLRVSLASVCHIQRTIRSLFPLLQKVSRNSPAQYRKGSAPTGEA